MRRRRPRRCPHKLIPPPPDGPPPSDGHPPSDGPQRRRPPGPTVLRSARPLPGGRRGPVPPNNYTRRQLLREVTPTARSPTVQRASRQETTGALAYPSALPHFGIG